MCKFFVVWGYDQALLGMLERDAVDILTINCNTIDETINWPDGQEADRWEVLCIIMHGKMQHQHIVAVLCKHNSKENVSASPMVTSDNSKINYFLPSSNKEAKRMVSTKTAKQLHSKFKDAFTGIGWFESTLSLQVKADSKSYQAPPWHVKYALKTPFKELRVTLEARHNHTTRHR